MALRPISVFALVRYEHVCHGKSIRRRIGIHLLAHHSGVIASQQVGDFSKNTVTTYRKLAANKDKLDEYADSIEDVPTTSTDWDGS